MIPLLAALWAAPIGAADTRPPYPAETLALVRQIEEFEFSPDGKRAAFVADITGTLEVWSVPVEGGWPDQLTALGQQPTGLRYSPDGKRIVFISDFGGDERGDIYMMGHDGDSLVNITLSTHAETSPRFSPDGADLAYTADPDRPFVYQLMVRHLITGHSKRLTFEPVNVHQPVWSPDGGMIAVTRSGDDQKGELLLVPMTGGGPRVIAPPVPGGILFAEDFSPNGRNILCRARNARGFMQLYLLEIKTGNGQFLGPDEWDVEEARWHAEAGIVFTRNVAGRSALYRMTGPKDGEVVLEPVGHIADLELHPSGSSAGILWGDSGRPQDVWMVELAGKRRRQVTRSTIGGLDAGTLARGEIFTYRSFDARNIHAVLIKPRVHRLGSPPPAVVVAHGGPDWQAFDDFSPLRQALAEAGFLVVAPNFRGSSGFGREFLDANNMDWGGGDLRDLEWAARRLGELGELDVRRVGVTGGSYGGYLTLMALTRSTMTWAAGVEAYGMPDLTLDFELSKDRFQDWYATEMGTPQSQPVLFRERSAIHFVDRIRAPLLIFQGANDTNVPPAESEKIHAALKARGSPVELVVYPDEGHGFTRRVNRTDYYRRTVDFFIKHLGRR